MKGPVRMRCRLLELPDGIGMAEGKTVPSGFFFTGQLLHLLLLAVLLFAVGLLVSFRPLQDGQFLGVSTPIWFVVALAVPIIHQIYVWLIWRGELCFGAVSGKLGPTGFVIYQAVFVVLLLSRPVTMVLLAISDYETREIPIVARIATSVLLLLPAIYTLYSVARYFGMDRACGIDHFDPSYRNLPMVREGIFRFTSNAMYTGAFLLLWAIAVAGASWSAFVVAAFSHAYIWVHYFCTERPDMRLIYGG
jgi:hypothetical protein